MTWEILGLLSQFNFIDNSSAPSFTFAHSLTQDFAREMLAESGRAERSGNAIAV